MTIETKTMARLTKEVYEDLEKKLPAPAVQRDTTDLQAGFQLGIQHVLKLLREGYVVGR
jgi:hypothetical protein